MHTKHAQVLKRSLVYKPTSTLIDFCGTYATSEWGDLRSKTAFFGDSCIVKVYFASSKPQQVDTGDEKMFNISLC